MGPFYSRTLISLPHICICKFSFISYKKFPYFFVHSAAATAANVIAWNMEMFQHLFLQLCFSKWHLYISYSFCCVNLNVVFSFVIVVEIVDFTIVAIWWLQRLPITLPLSHTPRLFILNNIRKKYYVKVRIKPTSYYDNLFFGGRKRKKR